MLRTFALIFGVVFLAIGAAGFFVLNPAGPGSTGGGLTMTHGEGVLLGLFPVNTLHNIAHLLFGVWGVLAYRSLGGSRTYFRGIAIGYGLLTVLGLIEATRTFFGYIPLHGNDVWLHAVLAIAGAYFGFMHREHAHDGR
jgi:hypothetical protein